VRANRRLVWVALLCVLVGLALGWATIAQAGYGIAPNSAITTSKPTFTVYLEPQELYTAEVYVAADPQYGSSYIPVHELGSCSPSTSTGAQGEYSCQPSNYSSPSYTSSLPPAPITGG
jgi:hypothetical protein